MAKERSKAIKKIVGIQRIFECFLCNVLCALALNVASSATTMSLSQTECTVEIQLSVNTRTHFL